MAWLGALFVFLFVVVCTNAAAPTYKTPTNVGMGANNEWFAGPCDYYRAAVFVDAFKQSRIFGKLGQPWVNDNFTYDAYGIPIGHSAFSAIMFGAPAPYNDLDGVWTFRITGANVTIDNSLLNPGCCKQVRNTTYNPMTKQTIAYMDCLSSDCPVTVGLNVNIYINSGNITGMECIRPGYPLDGYQMYTNAYLKIFSGFNTIRFMDWLNTNGALNVVEWSDRTPATRVQWSSLPTGQPWEAVVELCNELGSNCWINVPANASDDYMTQLATFMKANLNPNLAIYLEFSNEPWNFGFQIGWFTVNKALDANKTGNTMFNYDNGTNIYYMGYRWYIWRSFIAAQQFRKVFGDSAMMTRVRPVFNSQYNGEQIEFMSFIQYFYGPANNYFFAAAIAPYFGNANNSLPMDQNIAQVNASAWSTYSTTVDAMMRARKYGLELVAYEGGPDLTGAIATEPRLRTVVVEYVERMWSVGMLLFNYYVVGVQGFNYEWSTLDNIFNTTGSPKFMATQDLIAMNRPASTFTFPSYSNIDFASSFFYTVPQKNLNSWTDNWDTNRWNAWYYNFAEPSTNGAYYALTFQYTSSSKPMNLTLSLNNKVITTFILPNTTVSKNVTAYTLLTVPKVNVISFTLNNYPVPGGMYFLYFQRSSTQAPPYTGNPPLNVPYNASSTTTTTTTSQSSSSSASSSSGSTGPSANTGATTANNSNDGGRLAGSLVFVALLMVALMF